VAPQSIAAHTDQLDPQGADRSRVLQAVSDAGTTEGASATVAAAGVDGKPRRSTVARGHQSGAAAWKLQLAPSVSNTARTVIAGVDGM